MQIQHILSSFSLAQALSNGSGAFDAADDSARTDYPTGEAWQALRPPSLKTASAKFGEALPGDARLCQASKKDSASEDAEQPKGQLLGQGYIR